MLKQQLTSKWKSWIRRAWGRARVNQKGIEIKNELSDYPWINQNLSCSEIVQKDLKKFENKNPEIKDKKEPENKKDSPSL